MIPSPIHPFLMRLLQGTDAQSLAPPSADQVGWERIVSEADRQGVAAILYRWLRESGVVAQLPPTVLNDLKERILGLTAQNLLYAQELTSILRAFDSHCVDCMPLRGLALEEQLYGKSPARPMEDIDLLVRRESLSKVVAILEGLGFQEIDHRQGFAQHYYYTLKFAKDRHGTIIVEPHWTIAYPPFVDRVDMDSVWRRSSQGRVVGVPTRLLSREDLLLHLCCHLMHWHEQAPLLWHFEIDQLIRQQVPSLDWPQVILAARESGQALLVTRVLEMLRSLFNTPLPDPALLTLSSNDSSRPGKSTPGFLERRMADLLAGGSQLRGREQFAFFFTIKGLRAKLRYAFSLLFPSPAFMRFRYGPANAMQLPIRYGARFFQLFLEGARWVRDLLFASPEHHWP